MVLDKIKSWDGTSYPVSSSELDDDTTYQGLPQEEKVATLNELQKQWANTLRSEKPGEYGDLVRDLESDYDKKRQAVGGGEGPWTTRKITLQGGDGKPAGFAYVRHARDLSGATVQDPNTKDRVEVSWTLNGEESIEVPQVTIPGVPMPPAKIGVKPFQLSGVEDLNVGDELRSWTQSKAALEKAKTVEPQALQWPTRDYIESTAPLHSSALQEEAEFADIPDEDKPSMAAVKRLSASLRERPEIVDKMGQGFFEGLPGQIAKGFLKQGAAFRYAPAALLGDHNAVKEWQAATKEIDSDIEGQSKLAFRKNLADTVLMGVTEELPSVATGVLGGVALSTGRKLATEAVESAAKKWMAKNGVTTLDTASPLMKALNGGLGKVIGTAKIEGKVAGQLADRVVNAVGFLPSSARSGLQNMAETIDKAEEIRGQADAAEKSGAAPEKVVELRKKADDLEDRATANGWAGIGIETFWENMWLNEYMGFKSGRTMADVSNDVLKRKVGDATAMKQLTGRFTDFVKRVAVEGNKEGLEEIFAGASNRAYMNTFAEQNQDLLKGLPEEYLTGFFLGAGLAVAKRDAQQGKPEALRELMTRGLEGDKEAAESVRRVTGKDVTGKPTTQVVAPVSGEATGSTATPAEKFSVREAPLAEATRVVMQAAEGVSATPGAEVTGSALAEVAAEVSAKPLTPTTNEKVQDESSQVEGLRQEATVEAGPVEAGLPLEDQRDFRRSWEVMEVEGKVGVALLQRRLKLGYERATRMLALLEERGFVKRGDDGSVEVLKATPVVTQKSPVPVASGEGAIASVATPPAVLSTGADSSLPEVGVKPTEVKKESGTPITTGSKGGVKVTAVPRGPVKSPEASTVEEEADFLLSQAPGVSRATAVPDELRPMVDDLKRYGGVDVVFVRGQRGKEGLSRPGGKVILVNLDSRRAIQTIAWHEVKHTLEKDPAFVDALAKVKTNPRYHNYVAALESNPSYAPGEAPIEFGADVLGELARKRSFWRDIKQATPPTKFQRIKDAILDAIDALVTRLKGHIIGYTRPQNILNAVANLKEVRAALVAVFKERGGAAPKTEGEKIREAAANEQNTKTPADRPTKRPGQAVVREEEIPQAQEAAPISGESEDVETPVRKSTASEDAAYLALAADPVANREALQKMVDAAAKAAGYDVGPVYHGRSKEFDEFNLSREGAERAVFLTDDEAEANRFPEHWGRVAIDPVRAYVRGDFADVDYPGDDPLYEPDTMEGLLRDAREAEKDGVIIRGIQNFEGGVKTDTYAVFNPNQIKSADPVVYDDAGNVIPLSKRFDPASDDIRLSNAPEDSPTDVARHAELEAKHNAGTITDDEKKEAEEIVERAAKRAGYNVGPVYHGTDADFTSFDPEKIGSRTDRGLIGKGFYFHNDIDSVAPYGTKAVKAFLRAVQTFDFNGLPGFSVNQIIENNTGIRDKEKWTPWLLAHSYDSAKIWGQTMVLSPSQIKSADAFTGVPLDQRFDAGSDDIRFSNAEEPRRRVPRFSDQSAESVRKHLQRHQLVPDDVVLGMLGDYPGYLDNVVSFILGQREKWLAGTFTARDVAKAYALTVASQGADAVDVDTIRKVFPDFNPGPDYLSTGAKGQQKIRPEEAAAYWLFTPMGKRALDAIDKGEVDREAWNDLFKLRKVYGDDRMTNIGVALTEEAELFPVYKKGKDGKALLKDADGNPIPELNEDGTPKMRELRLRPETQASLFNIQKVVDAINASKGDPQKLDKAVLVLRGIGEAKKAFIGHLLGFGNELTIDAVEINYWITGVGDTSELGRGKDKSKNQIAYEKYLNELSKAVPTDKKSVTDLSVRIKAAFQRLKALHPKAGAIPEEVFNHVMHHWLWDRAKKIETAHKGMMDAMVRASNAEEPADTAYLTASKGDTGTDPLTSVTDQEKWAKKNPQSAAVMRKVVEDRMKAAGASTGQLFHSGSFSISEGEPVFNTTKGVHFGTLRAAEDRVGGAYVDNEVESADVFEESGRYYLDEDVWPNAPSNGFGSDAAARSWVAGEVNLDSQDLETNLTKVFLFLKNTKRTTDAGSDWGPVVSEARREGFDSIVYRNEFEDKGSTSYIAFSPSQIKSADLATFRDDGSIIPPSERANEKEADIRWSNAEEPENLKRVFNAQRMPEDVISTQLQDILNVANRHVPTTNLKVANVKQALKFLADLRDRNGPLQQRIAADVREVFQKRLDNMKNLAEREQEVLVLRAIVIQAMIGNTIAMASRFQAKQGPENKKRAAQLFNAAKQTAYASILQVSGDRYTAARILRSAQDSSDGSVSAILAQMMTGLYDFIYKKTGFSKEDVADVEEMVKKNRKRAQEEVVLGTTPEGREVQSLRSKVKSKLRKIASWLGIVSESAENLPPLQKAIVAQIRGLLQRIDDDYRGNIMPLVEKLEEAIREFSGSAQVQALNELKQAFALIEKTEAAEFAALGNGPASLDHAAQKLIGSTPGARVSFGSGYGAKILNTIRSNVRSGKMSPEQGGDTFVAARGDKTMRAALVMALEADRESRVQQDELKADAARVDTWIAEEAADEAADDTTPEDPAAAVLAMAQRLLDRELESDTFRSKKATTALQDANTALRKFAAADPTISKAYVADAFVKAGVENTEMLGQALDIAEAARMLRRDAQDAKAADKYLRKVSAATAAREKAQRDAVAKEAEEEARVQNAAVTSAEKVALKAMGISPTPKVRTQRQDAQAARDRFVKGDTKETVESVSEAYRKAGYTEDTIARIVPLLEVARDANAEAKKLRNEEKNFEKDQAKAKAADLAARKKAMARSLSLLDEGQKLIDAALGVKKSKTSPTKTQVASRLRAQYVASKSGVTKQHVKDAYLEAGYEASDALNIMLDKAETARLLRADAKADKSAKRAAEKADKAAVTAEKKIERMAANVFRGGKEKSGRKTSVSEDILNTINEHEEWNISNEDDQIQIIEAVLVKRGVEPEDARKQAASLVKEFNDKLANIVEKEATKFAKKLARGKVTENDIRQAVRLHLLDPSSSIATVLASLKGWKGLTDDQLTELNKSLAVSGEIHDAQVRLSILLKQQRIILRATGLDPKTHELLSSMTRAAAYSGAGAILLNFIVPISATIVAVTREFMASIISRPKQIGEITRSTLKALGNSIQNAAVSARIAFKYDATLGLSAAKDGAGPESVGVLAIDALTARMDQAVDRINDPKTSKKRKAWEYLMLAYTSQKLLWKTFGAADSAAIALLQEFYSEMKVNRDLRRAGRDPSKEFDAFIETINSGERFAIEHLDLTPLQAQKEMLTRTREAYYEYLMGEDIGIDGFEIHKEARRESLSIIGNHEEVQGTFSQIGNWVANASAHPKLTGLGNWATGPVRIISQVMDYGVWYMPLWNIRRYMKEKKAQAEGKGRFTLHAGSARQLSRRFQDVVAGNIISGILIALLAAQDDDNPWFEITLGYPTDPAERQRWQQKKLTEYTMYFGDEVEGRTAIRFTRGMFEFLTMPAIVAEHMNRVTRGKETPVMALARGAWDIMGVGTPVVQSVENIASDLKSGSEKELLKEGAYRLSTLTPWSGAQRSIAKMGETPAKDSSNYLWSQTFPATAIFTESGITFRNSLDEDPLEGEGAWNFMVRMGLPVGVVTPHKTKEPVLAADFEKMDYTIPPMIPFATVKKDHPDIDEETYRRLNEERAKAFKRIYRADPPPGDSSDDLRTAKRRMKAGDKKAYKERMSAFWSSATHEAKVKLGLKKPH